MLKEPISAYKNIHAGEKCFIIATGPSLIHEPIEVLSSEVTFGCNTLYKHDFKTDYYCVCDELVWENHKRPIMKKYQAIFSPFQSKINFRLYDEWLEFGSPNYGIATKGIYRAHTVVGCILQLCYWMGFRKVFLLGCDCSYEGERHHFDGSSVDNYLRHDWEEVFEKYQIARDIYERSGREIYNCTSGGRLEVFKRINLADAILE